MSARSDRLTIRLIPQIDLVLRRLQIVRVIRIEPSRRIVARGPQGRQFTQVLPVRGRRVTSERSQVAALGRAQMRRAL